MLTSINEERGQVSAQRGGRVVNGEDGVIRAYGNHTSQSSLRPLAKTRHVSSSTPLTRYALALMFLW